MSNQQPWILDPARHPPKASVLRRGCMDITLSIVATLLCIATGGYAAYVYLFGNNATPYPLGLLAVCIITAIELRLFGEVALYKNWPVLTYVHMIIYYVLIFTLIWLSILNWIYVKQSLEYVEENWYLLQATVFMPFTTLIDQKNYVASGCWALFWFGLITGILALTPLFDAWKAMGGTIRMVQSKLGIIIPEFIVLFAAAVGTLAFDDVAATIAAYSVAHSTSALLWQSACAGLTIIGIISVLVAACVWGSTFLTHATAALIFAPCGFIIAITSTVTLSRAGEVEAYVAQNWQSLKLFVPPEYAALSPDKYAMASYTPMAAAGATGLFLAFLLICAVIMHIKCATIVANVGSELYALQCNKAIPGVTNAARAEESEAPLLSSAASYGAFSSGGNSDSGNTTKGAGALPSYNSIGNKPDDHGFAMVTFDHGVKDHAIEEPQNVYGLDAKSFAAAKHNATVAFAKYLAAHNVPHLGMHKEWPEEQLVARVKPLSCGLFCRSLASGWGEAWRNHRFCVIPTLVALVLVLIGMAVSLAQLEKAGQCGILARAAVSTSYNTTFNVEFAHHVDIFSDFPFGAVEVVADHYASALDHHATVEITYFAADGGDLPGQADFINSIILSGYGHETDDDVGGYYNTSIVLKAPADAATKCIAARLRFVTAAYRISYSIYSSKALVNVTGNAADLAGGATVALISGISARTDQASVMLSSAYIEDIIPSNPNDPGFTVEPHVTITSSTGDVFLSLVSAPGITVNTGGTIRASNTVSAALLTCQAACGDIALTTTGSGRIAVSQAFGANNAKLSTEHGVIVGANTGVIVGRRLDINSVDGKIYLVNFLQAAGNETFVSTANDISVSAIFANRLTVNAREGGKVSIVEGFVGFAPGTFVKPPLANDSYAAPLLSVQTDRGGISILGAGCNPGNAAFADSLSMSLVSNIGDIKIEVNGGGFNGNYTVASGRGASIVELDGSLSPSKGTIGEGGSGFNSIWIFSDGGDVQLSVLPSPL